MLRQRWVREPVWVVVWAVAGATVDLGGPSPWWHGMGASEIGRLCLGVAMLAAIPWRERRPIVFVIVAIVVAPVGFAASQVPLVGVYTVAKLCRRPVAVTVTVVAVVIGVLAVLSRGRPVDMIPFAIMSVTLHLTATSFGLFIGARDQLVDSLHQRARRAEADQAAHADQVRLAERRRIASEMHDVLGHRLSLLSVHTGALELRGGLPSEYVRSTAAILRATTHEAMSDLRQIVSVLREPTAELSDVTPATVTLDDLEQLARQARAAGTPTELVIADRLRADPPPEPLRRTTYRVVQEGLTNARRHRPGCPVRVTVASGMHHGLTVDVSTDPAPDQPPSRSPAGSGTGLIGLTERVKALTDGTVTHHIDTDGTHRLHVVMPRPPQAPP